MMKKFFLVFVAIAMCLLSVPAFSQDKDNKVDTTNKLGLAGDGLDLYAVLDLFQKSKTIESFEKSLNDPKTKINNLDLDLDKKVDFIKVVTEKKDKKDESYMFILRVDVSKTESQDVAVILLDRDKDKKVSMQIVGDEELYGKDYVIEPKGNSPVTPNPAYKGEDPVTVTVEAPATNVVVQQAPVVQYVYSPAYVPYYPPYYYGYYPGWFAFTAVVSFGFYAAAWGGYHGGYYGGHYGGHNTVVINNNNNFNNYNNNSRNRATQVSDNQARGNYGNGRTDRQAGTRPTTSDRAGASNRAGTSDRAGASQRPTTSDRAGATNKAGTSDRTGASNRAGTSDRAAGGASTSNRQTPSTSNRSSSFSSPSNRSSSSSSFGGGGRSMGGGGGGRSFGGGGGGRRR
jgi:hypothetical protein